ncbi:MAG: dockerin type I repeat-containing protein, partial [Gemmatimonadota bacterium]|nr:dockerin type I repeat-containing protein [Gemmatimonadota bacterium]
SLESLRAHAQAAVLRYQDIAGQKEIDLEAPLVTAEPYRPDNQPAAYYDIRATVTDATAVDVVSLYWRIEGATGFINALQMGPGPGADEFEGQIPVQEQGQVVEYYIEAIDAQGNLGTLPQDAPESFFSFSAPDTLGPQISSAGHSYDTTNCASGYIISANMQDNGLLEVAAVLDYNTQDTWADTLALEPPTQGAVVWSVPLDGLEWGTRVNFFIMAADSTGNVSTAPVTAPETFYSFLFLPPLAGDVDLSGEVDIFDLIAMLQILSGSLNPGGVQFCTTDVNGSGAIDIFDLLALLGILAH